MAFNVFGGSKFQIRYNRPDTKMFKWIKDFNRKRNEIVGPFVWCVCELESFRTGEKLAKTATRDGAGGKFFFYFLLPPFAFSTIWLHPLWISHQGPSSRCYLFLRYIPGTGDIFWINVQTLGTFWKPSYILASSNRFFSGPFFKESHIFWE